MKRKRQGERRLAGACYDHVSGKLGEALFVSLVKKRWIRESSDSRGYEITEPGWRGLESFGIDVRTLLSSRRKIVCSCVERHEGRFYDHPGAHLGALFRFFELGWLSRKGKRYEITQSGSKGLEQLGIFLQARNGES